MGGVLLHDDALGDHAQVGFAVARVKGVRANIRLRGFGPPIVRLSLRSLVCFHIGAGMGWW